MTLMWLYSNVTRREGDNILMSLPATWAGQEVAVVDTPTSLLQYLVKSPLPITYISVNKSFWNFAESMAV